MQPKSDDKLIEVSDMHKNNIALNRSGEEKPNEQ